MGNKKSVAKANGLKSTFTLDENTAYMTSFGRGNAAQPEKHIRNATVTDIHHTFCAKTDGGSTVHIEGRAGESDVLLPDAANQLHAKDTVEQMYFGKAFSDNIHIQIAYNIMDIKKIFGVYANIIVHTVNNLCCDGEKQDDFLGSFKAQNRYQIAAWAHQIISLKLVNERPNNNGSFLVDEKVWNKYIKTDLKSWHLAVIAFMKQHPEKYSDRDLKIVSGSIEKEKKPDDFIVLEQIVSDFIVQEMGIKNKSVLTAASKTYTEFETVAKHLEKSAYYFSDIFSGKDGNFDKKKTFSILRVLGNMRQEAFHEQDNSATWLYNLDAEADEDIKAALNTVVDTKVNGINTNFAVQNKVNLLILQEIYPQKSKADLVREYYDFSVRKAFKNLGFSVKTLRETMLAFEAASAITNEKYDTVRGKLYSLFDFVIYNYCLENEMVRNAFVEELRANLDKENKPALYQNFAEKVWTEIGDIVLRRILPQMKGTAIQGKSKEKDFDSVKVQAYVQAPQDLSLFSKAVYCISMFLDGKEINSFLSALINKFENIASLCQVLTYNGLESDFIAPFTFFADSQAIAEDLRYIKSIARMSKGKKATKNSRVTVKEMQYFDAAAVLGETDTEKVKAAFHLGNKSASTADKAFRNFVVNNVINSNRFVYVVRFINPKNARDIMQNRALIAFALKDIPQSQLVRYCGTAGIACNADEPDTEAMVNALADMLLQVRFDTFSNVQQKVKANSAEAVQKEKYKAIIGLYLTVLYLLVKTLVKINMNYAIAFGVLERDCQIMNRKYGKNPKNDRDAFYLRKREKNQYVYNVCAITELFKENGWLNKRVQKSVENNKALYSNEVFYEYRNHVAHLSVIAEFPKCAKGITKVKSLFDVYHYILVMLIYGDEGRKLPVELKEVPCKNGKTVLENAWEHQTVCKDFLYGLNTPFAYNAARYINLSNREKFLAGFGK